MMQRRLERSRGTEQIRERVRLQAKMKDSVEESTCVLP
jgi:hypothetical protein